MEHYFLIKSDSVIGENEIKEALALVNITAGVEMIQVHEGLVHDLLLPKERVLN